MVFRPTNCVQDFGRQHVVKEIREGTLMVDHFRHDKSETGEIKLDKVWLNIYGSIQY